MAVQGQGYVYLVGAGPGDPGLITQRAVECLRLAGVVVHDRLINESLLDYAPQAELIDVGKQPNHHPVPQEEINAILVDQAQAGKQVVRLKGGDPFVFGRGGEEALALYNAGIPFEVVPGITSAVAAPAYAGIPITHRGVACSAVVITGHRADCAEDPQSDWMRAARGADTLVFLMGVKNLPDIVDQLLAAGRPQDTPVALIEQGTLCGQKTITGTLEDIVARAAAIRPPAIIVVGEVVNLREQLRWFDLPEVRPLLGLRVLNTRPQTAPAREDSFNRQLAALGARPLRLPTFIITPVQETALLDQAIERLSRGDGYDWIAFTSANGVHYFLERLYKSGFDARCLSGARLAAVGRATAEALADHHLKADFVPTVASGVGLVAELDNLSGSRVLLPRSDIAPETLIRELEARGAAVDPVPAYTVRPLEPDPANLEMLVSGQVDVAVFCSPSALHGLQDMLAGRDLAAVLKSLTVACVGPGAAAAAEQLGVRVDVIASQPTTDGVCQALVDFYRRRPAIEAALTPQGEVLG